MEFPGTVCSKYSGNMLSFPHGVNRNAPGTAPNCGMGWWPCYEDDGTSMGCFACHDADPAQGFCNSIFSTHEQTCRSYGKRPVV